VRDAEDFADAVAVGAFAGGAAFLGEPGFEVLHHDGVFDGNVDGGDADDVEAVGDGADPVFAVERGEGESDGFVESGGGDLSGVLDAVHVEEGDAARASGHGGKIAYSLFVRHEKAVSGDW